MPPFELTKKHRICLGANSLAQTSTDLLPLQVVLHLRGETEVHDALLELGRKLVNASELLSQASEWVAAAALTLGGSEEWVTLGERRLPFEEDGADEEENSSSAEAKPYVDSA